MLVIKFTISEQLFDFSITGLLIPTCKLSLKYCLLWIESRVCQKFFIQLKIGLNFNLFLKLFFINKASLLLYCLDLSKMDCENSI